MVGDTTVGVGSGNMIIKLLLTIGNQLEWLIVVL